MKKVICVLFSIICLPVYGAKIVATVNDSVITDTDVNARVVLMKAQNQDVQNIRDKALENIISDYVKLGYAEQFKLNPSDKELSEEIKKIEKSMNQSGGYLKSKLSANGYDDNQLMNAVKASLGWQNVLVRMVMPMVDISDDQVKEEIKKITIEHGLPLKLVLYRITDLTKDNFNAIADAKSETCMKVIDDVKANGGNIQKIEVTHYDLDISVRKQLKELDNLSFSNYNDGVGFFICKSIKTEEYKKLENYVHQGMIGKEIMFHGDQILKTQKRKAVIVKK